MIRSGLVRFHDDLAPLLTPIDAVRQHPENYNNGDVEEIAASIEIDGMYSPIKAQRSTGHIIAGNHTWEACKSLHATDIPVVWLDVDDTAARRIMWTDNRLASLARPDRSAELALLERVREEAPDLPVPGMNDFTLDTLRALAEMEVSFEHASWPSLNIQIHPRILKAFREITREADTDRDRFEVLLRLAGWDGT